MSRIPAIDATIKGASFSLGRIEQVTAPTVQPTALVNGIDLIAPVVVNAATSVAKLGRITVWINIPVTNVVNAVAVTNVSLTAMEMDGNPIATRYPLLGIQRVETDLA